MLQQLFLSIHADLEACERALTTHLESTSQPLIRQVSGYVVANGGKRLRPALFLLCARMAGASDANLPHIAAAFEMIHTASLLHDDVVDNALLRRGRPSTKAKWGNQISVLVGDFLWTKGCGLLVQYGSLRLLDIVTRSIIWLTEGAVAEISKQNDIHIGTEGYFEIIRGKTSSLFGACCEGAGEVADISEPFIEALKRYGIDLGVAFQLADDALDYVSDEKVFGKTAGGDLREGKMTYPLIVALEKANEEEQKLLHNTLIADHVTDAHFQRVLDVIKKYDGIEETLKLSREYAEKAKAQLQLFKPSIERDALLAATDYAVDRVE
ncbi:MAG: hypothetical protein COX62_02810 [Deltaproteobacteria bacterium CG_4_10_14_0_2_um_filter_43_8]|nr:MAG: hypothetical protein COV43_02745 [Deltaproteobacteria bacterium CG11_big_fil_rev_8_21_14_0_20_42_23]PJA21286.1 MAG: hypothetical protein COX62_02810 [Deltaproteobacteria bacterium CG_4_10_14_0_2_um_filter_43_8]PJC63829.1 MAG: hypothetical protein CO021_07455 [Deltaproteobacteria bacterium CG_4_9_14_0_2_um_filter_42_21]